MPSLYSAELGYVPRLSGHIKVVSWALLAMEILFRFVFGWGGVRRGSVTVLMRFKAGSLA